MCIPLQCNGTTVTSTTSFDGACFTVRLLLVRFDIYIYVLKKLLHNENNFVFLGKTSRSFYERQTKLYLEMRIFNFMFLLFRIQYCYKIKTR